MSRREWPFMDMKYYRDSTFGGFKVSSNLLSSALSLSTRALIPIRWSFVTLLLSITHRPYDGDELACLSNSFDVRFWFGPALLPDIHRSKRAQCLGHNGLISEGGEGNCTCTQNIALGGWTRGLAMATLYFAPRLEIYEGLLS